MEGALPRGCSPAESQTTLGPLGTSSPPGLGPPQAPPPALVFHVISQAELMEGTGLAQLVCLFLKGCLHFLFVHLQGCGPALPGRCALLYLAGDTDARFHVCLSHLLAL